MKAVILAAGYATRLESVTEGGRIAKTMLPITKEGKTQPMLFYLLDKINAINEEKEIVDEIIVLSNEKYTSQIAKACSDYEREVGGVEINVVSDGTTCKEEALGANGDLRLVNYLIKDDVSVLIVGSDNYFDFSLSDLVKAYKKKRKEVKKDISMMVSKEYPSEMRSTIQKNYGMLNVDSNGKVVNIVEKPLVTLGYEVESNLVSTACYLLDRQHFAKIDEYMSIFENDKKRRDSLGFYIGWLAENIDLYNFSFDSEFVDIGTPNEYYEALNGSNKTC